MYDRASQRPKNGGGETSLGSFSGWENDYLLMKYENGQGCWNGPNRWQLGLRIRVVLDDKGSLLKTLML